MAQLLSRMPDALVRFTKEGGRKLNVTKSTRPDLAKGIPCIKVAQERSATMKGNASTVATFFAGVAATTLELTIRHNENTIQVATNTLLLSSIVLSIGSATTALLAMTWQQAVLYVGFFEPEINIANM